MSNVPPTYWTGHRDEKTNATPTLTSELEMWKKAFWVGDYAYRDLLMLLAKHQINVR